MAELRISREGAEEARGEPPGASPTHDELRVAGEHLLQTIRDVIHEGNFRRITIRNDHGHTLLEIPLSIGLAGAMFMPVWAAIGAMAAMATGYTILIERPKVSDPDTKAGHS